MDQTEWTTFLTVGESVSCYYTINLSTVRRAAKIDKSALITLLAQPIYLMALKAIIDAELLYNLPMIT
jgi:hypothetical protein